MYYSVIGMIAIVLHLIMNHEFLKIDKNRDEIDKAFRKFVLASLMYFVTDVLWGILDSLKVPKLLYVEDSFIQRNRILKKAHLPAVHQVGDDFLKNNENIVKEALNKVKKDGVETI